MRNWYALFTKHHHENKVIEYLGSQEIEHYLPLVLMLRQWKDRKVWLDMPLFPCYVFVYCNIADKKNLLNRTRGVVSIVGSVAPEIIPDYQIDSIKQALASQLSFEHIKEFVKGEDVLVIKGPLKGIRGKFIEQRNEHLLVLQVDLINQGIAMVMERNNVAHYTDSSPLPCSIIND
jgi:transcription antitermination factor NusG